MTVWPDHPGFELLGEAQVPGEMLVCRVCGAFVHLNAGGAHQRFESIILASSSHLSADGRELNPLLDYRVVLG